MILILIKFLSLYHNAIVSSHSFNFFSHFIDDSRLSFIKMPGNGNWINFQNDSIEWNIYSMKMTKKIQMTNQFIICKFFLKTICVLLPFFSSVKKRTHQHLIICAAPNQHINKSMQKYSYIQPTERKSKYWCAWNDRNEKKYIRKPNKWNTQNDNVNIRMQNNKTKRPSSKFNNKIYIRTHYAPIKPTRNDDANRKLKKKTNPTKNNNRTIKRTHTRTHTYIHKTIQIDT